MLEEAAESPCTYHVFPIRVRARDRLVRELARAGISTRIHYPLALPDQPALHNLYPTRSVVTARDWASRELSLPIFPGMTRHEVDSVVQVVNEHTRVRRHDTVTWHARDESGPGMRPAGSEDTIRSGRENA